jgi:hypothetical protein
MSLKAVSRRRIAIIKFSSSGTLAIEKARVFPSRHPSPEGQEVLDQWTGLP